MKKLDVCKLNGSKLHVVDASAVARSKYHYFKELSYIVNGEEIGTGAMYGLLSIFKNIPLNEKVIFCFDVGGSLRKLEDSKYKSNRKSADSDYFYQMDLARDMLISCDFEVYGEEGYEADDFIAYITDYYKDKYDHVIIYTNDCDLAELVDDNVYIKNVISKRADITKSNYEEVLNIPYNTIRLKKALTGCTSDNVKGIHGFGDKTFLKFLDKVKNDYDLSLIRKNNLEEEIIRKYIPEDKLGYALHSLKLVERRIPNNFRLENEYRGVNKDLFLWFLKRYGMKSLINVL